MSEFTVEIEASAGANLSDGQMVKIDESLRSAPCVVGPSVSSNVRTGSFGVTMTIVAPSHAEATKRASEAFEGAMAAIGLVAADPERIASQREPVLA
jgi:hypothetical protein